MMRLLIERYSNGIKSAPVREYACHVLRSAGVAPRDYPSQIQALLEHVQCFYYLWERQETFQTPLYTLRHKFGDCDDLTMALGAMLESICIPVRIEVLGKIKKTTGLQKLLGGGRKEFSHVYLRAGLPPKKPIVWLACETTMPFEMGAEPISFVRSLSAKS